MSVARITTICLLAPCLAVLPAGAASAAPCRAMHWVGVWAAPPSDASQGTDISDLFSPSGQMKSALSNETVRAILTPTLGGATLRVHLSNRFGSGPLTFARVTVARRAAAQPFLPKPGPTDLPTASGGKGAAVVPGSLTPVTFGGAASVTAVPGKDVVSDPVRLRFKAFESLVVSVYVPGDVGNPTEHYTARQTSYLTPAGAGDHTGDAAGDAFTKATTTRPFVTGIDVRARRSVGAVVAFGDSITDGFQGQPAGVPETAEGIDADGRWPDVLGRRLRTARLPLAVLNEGISGNRVLRDGLEGDPQGRDTYGPAALRRLDADVLAQAGVTTVILLEGVNDVGQDPNASSADVIAGYRQLIGRLHRAGLRVLQGTLTPFGGNQYDSAAREATRQAINAWIRTKSSADGVVDFDRAVRDPGDPSRIDPRYDGSDHLHFNLAGYRRMGEQVALSGLSLPRCSRR